MSQAQTLKTAVHELAHSVMHDAEPSKERSSLPGRGTREVQAESVAYVVSSWLGLDTSDYSFGYIASWSDGRDVERAQGVARRDTQRLARDNRRHREGGLEDTRAGRARASQRN